jgi:hypothetical protein
MNAIEPKQRMTFSIDATVKRQFERAVPKSQRSNFVEDLIAQAVKEHATQDALKAIREFKPYPLNGPGVVETLRQTRAERSERLAVRSSKAKK